MASDLQTLAEYSQQLIDAGRYLFTQGWSPATSSNYSIRLDAENILITVSGKHKGQLTPYDLMLIDYQGIARDANLRPSAETALHTQLYHWSGLVECVLHTHSVMSTILSRQWPTQELVLRDYEMLKAFAGASSHTTAITIPIFANTQDIASLAREVDAYLQIHRDTPAYLIRGHGLYTWGRNIAETLRHIEALEFLLNCEWQQWQRSKT